MNNFRFLMSPLMIMTPYTYESMAGIVTDIRHARISSGEFPGYLIQAHLTVIHEKKYYRDVSYIFLGFISTASKL